MSFISLKLVTDVLPIKTLKKCIKGNTEIKKN